VLRDRTGDWNAAVWLDAAIVVAGLIVILPIRADRRSAVAGGAGGAGTAVKV